MGWGDSFLDFLGNTTATATGTLGAAAGGLTSLATRGNLSGVGEGWNAGASFSPLGTFGNDARAAVRARHPNEAVDRTIANTPGGPWVAIPARLGFDALLPAETQRGAQLDAVFLAIPGGRAAERGVSRTGLFSWLVRGGERDAERSGERAAERAGARTAETTFADDIARRSGPDAATRPLLGRTTSAADRSFLIKSGVVAGGTFLGIQAIQSFRTATQGADPFNPVAQAGEDAGKGAAAAGAGLGSGFQDLFGGLGNGLGSAFANLLGGTGAGVGAGIANTGEGIAAGAKALLLPALLIGGGFLAYKALEGHTGTRRRTTA